MTVVAGLFLLRVTLPSMFRLYVSEGYATLGQPVPFLERSSKLMMFLLSVLDTVPDTMCTSREKNINVYVCMCVHVQVCMCVYIGVYMCVYLCCCDKSLRVQHLQMTQVHCISVLEAEAWQGCAPVELLRFLDSEADCSPGRAVPLPCSK